MTNCAGQRLAPIASPGDDPFAANGVPRSQKPRDFALMRPGNQWLAMPSLEMNRDRIENRNENHVCIATRNWLQPCRSHQP
jgi:hypothetical protein